MAVLPLLCVPPAMVPCVWRAQGSSSAPSVAIVQPIQAVSVQLSPILPLDLTSDAQASSMRPPHTPVDKCLRLGSTEWRSPLSVQVTLLCLPLTGSCALL